MEPMKEETENPLKIYTPMIIAVAATIGAGLVCQLPYVRYSRVGTFLFQKRVGHWKGEDYWNGLNLLTFSLIETIRDFVYGELVLISIYLAGLICFILVGQQQFALPLAKTSDFVWCHVATLHWTFVLFPVYKNSLLNILLGTSFERMIKFHRIIGKLGLCFTYVHMLTQFHVQGANVLQVRPSLLKGLYGLICFSITTVVAWEPIRRRFWHIFIGVHVLFAPLGFLFAILHVHYMAWLMPIPLALWAADIILRLWLRPFHSYQVQTVEAIAMDATLVKGPSGLQPPSKDGTQLESHSSNKPSTQISRLTLDVTGFPQNFEPGSYCFLNIPSVSIYQFHPFSISSYPAPSKDGPNSSPTRISFHILNNGPKGQEWTHRLYQQLNQNPGSELKVRVDGPYGKLKIDLSRYRTLVLVAGGIGITPFFSILDFLSHQLASSHPDYRDLASIHLIWTARQSAVFHQWYPELMSKLSNLPIVKVSLYSTADNSCTTTSDLELGEMSHSPPSIAGVIPASDSLSSSPSQVVTIIHVDPKPIEAASLESSPSMLKPQSGRPNFRELFSTLGAATKWTLNCASLPGHHIAARSLIPNETVAVLACGPSPLVASVQQAAAEQGFHFHKETFAF